MAGLNLLVDSRIQHQSRYLAEHSGVSPVLKIMLHFCFTEGFLFVLGGQDENKGTLSSGEKYDPDTNSWSSLPPMNEARFKFWN